jgi:hypothetical protein
VQQNAFSLGGLPSFGLMRYKTVTLGFWCAVLCPTLAAAQGTGATVIRGFLDAGYPGPTGEPAIGVAFWLAPVPADGAWGSCVSPVDSAQTDTLGRFRLVVPAAVRRAWRLCSNLIVSTTPGSRPPRDLLFPLYQYRGRGADSVQVYCRGHGPAGSPECRWVRWGRALKWPGGEGYDNIARPPTKLTARKDRRAEPVRLTRVAAVNATGVS